MWFANRAPVKATPELRRRAERDSILSTCAGAMGDVTLTNSAVIILYATMLGAGDMFSLVTTALCPLFNGLCIIPMAWIATRIGKQCLILRVCSIQLVMFLLLCAAPFFGSAAVAVMLLALAAFSILNTGYVAGWFPMIDTFLTPERRNSYLGRMRFLWQFASAAFLFAIGLIIGKNPPLAHLQIVLLTAAFIYAGRIFFISRIPVFITEQNEAFTFKTGLLAALRNKPLVGFSAYLFALNLAAYGSIPLTTIYLKRHLGAPDNIIVLISSVTLGGMLTGSLCAGAILCKFGIKNTLLGIHIVYALTNGMLFFMGKNVMPPAATYAVIGVLLFCYSFTFANANVASTSEMLALSTPGNKVMAMAFCGAFNYTGSGLSRFLTSLVLGAGLLAPSWHLGTMTFCHYQTIYLGYVVAIIFAAMFLVVVPAVFPKGKYIYTVH